MLALELFALLLIGATMIRADGPFTLLAGSFTATSDNLDTGSSAAWDETFAGLTPTGPTITQMVYDTASNLYFSAIGSVGSTADGTTTFNDAATILQLTSDGTLSTYSGTGDTATTAYATVTCSDDPFTTTWHYPSALAFRSGNILVVGEYQDGKLYTVSPMDQSCTFLAGSSTAATATNTQAITPGAGSAAVIPNIVCVAVDSSDIIYGYSLWGGPPGYSTPSGTIFKVTANVVSSLISFGGQGVITGIAVNNNQLYLSGSNPFNLGGTYVLAYVVSGNSASLGSAGPLFPSYNCTLGGSIGTKILMSCLDQLLYAFDTSSKAGYVLTLTGTATSPFYNEFVAVDSVGGNTAVMLRPQLYDAGTTNFASTPVAIYTATSSALTFSPLPTPTPYPTPSPYGSNSSSNSSNTSITTTTATTTTSPTGTTTRTVTISYSISFNIPGKCNATNGTFITSITISLTADVTRQLGINVNFTTVTCGSVQATFTIPASLASSASVAAGLAIIVGGSSWLTSTAAALGVSTSALTVNGVTASASNFWSAAAVTAPACWLLLATTAILLLL